MARTQRVMAALCRWFRADSPGDYFREQSLTGLVALIGVPAWLWIANEMQLQRLTPASEIALMGLILGVGLAVFRWHRTHYLPTVGMLVLAQMAFIATMLWLLRNPSIGYLFLLAVVTGSLLGTVGAFAAAVGSTLVAFAMTRALLDPADAMQVLLGQAVLYLLTAAVTTWVGHGLHQALDSAERSAQEASRHAQQARQHRAELHRTLKSLELAWAQLQRANSELFHAREAADAALRFKSEQAAQISHELRTSLNLVLGFSETMAFSQNSYGVKLPAPYLRDVMEIQRSSRHLLTLIDDVLDLSRLEAGRMGLHREPVDLGPMLQEATDIARPLVERKGLDLVLDLPRALPVLMLDRARIRQVVLNLLSNAVRVTAHGHIRVTARGEAGQVVVQVSDTGPGISAEHLSRVFEDFYQAGAGTGGSAGLGLAVSRRIVGLHGGRMWAESTAGIGSTFSFAIPLPEGPSYSDTTYTPAPMPEAVQPTVIAVGEPDSDETRLLRRHLEGYAVLSVPTWESAASLAHEANARAVIIDATLAEAPDPASLPVPVIACPLPGPSRAARALGVGCFLAKPVTAQTIQAALQRVAPRAASLLLVDDDRAAVRLLERMVQGAERTYRLFRAYSGKEALARIRVQRPDAVVLDLAMADGDGRWLIAALRAEPATAEIPLLVVTGHPAEEVWQGGWIGVANGAGFPATDTLRYLQALLSAVPPVRTFPSTTSPPSPVGHPG